jgi:hypothetical protein
MPNQPHPGPDTDYGDSLANVGQFALRYSHIYKNESRVRWLLRDRNTNGLVATGAVVEVFANGDVPSLFIHIPSWFAWMRSGGRRSPQSNHQ